jgi:serine/threonine protein kinase
MLEPNDPESVGRWRVDARLGAGGMGVVYRAHDDNEICALKVARPDLANDAAFRLRFRREIDAMRSVRSRCVAQVIEADADAPLPWMACEFVDGPTLEDVVRGSGPLQPHTLLKLATMLAEGLVSVHSVEIVHRDLKPANVLLPADGVRIVDFGIASSAAATAVTQTGQAFGSPAFMSPEQAMGLPVTSASDIFSLASVIVFAATGRGPFGTGAASDVLYRVVHDEPKIPPLPAPLDRLVRQALSKDPHARPSAAAMYATLVDSGKTVPVVPPLPVPRRKRSRRVAEAVFAVAVVAIALVAATIFVLADNSSITPARAAVATNQTATTRAVSSTTTPPPTTAPVPALPLESGPYGFLVPSGWDREPLSGSFFGSTSTARFDDPTSSSSMLYAISGGNTDTVYNEDGSVNIRGAIQEVCSDTSVQRWFAVGDDAAGYACTDSDPGSEVNGVVIVSPDESEFTWKKLEITLPTSLHASATTILNSFTLDSTTCPCPFG